MSDEHAIDLSEPDRAHELSLSSFATINEDSLTTAPNEHARHTACRCWCARGSSKHDEVEIHREWIVPNFALSVGQP
jgi:hypothetical protein